MSTPPAARPRFDVFLSHSTADKPAVEAIGARLRGDGFRAFLDKWNLVPGKKIGAQLEERLRTDRKPPDLADPDGAARRLIAHLEKSLARSP